MKLTLSEKGRIQKCLARCAVLGEFKPLALWFANDEGDFDLQGSTVGPSADRVCLIHGG